MSDAAQVLKPGATPYSAGVIAGLLNVEVSAFDTDPTLTEKNRQRLGPGTAPLAGAPGSAPLAGAPGSAPLAGAPGAHPRSPSENARSPGSGSAAQIKPSPTQIQEGYSLLTTQCGIGRTEQQICSADNAFCYAPNYHCCGQGSQPAFCPGKVTPPATPRREDLSLS